MTDIVARIMSALGAMSEPALKCAGAMAMAGVIAMAILQILKEFVPIRRWYQVRWLDRWFAERSGRLQTSQFLEMVGARGRDRGWSATDAEELFRSRLPVNKTRAQATLVELATGGEVNAFYDLPAEQLVAQINAAAQVALENPVRHFDLLAVVSQGAELSDLASVVALSFEHERAINNPRGAFELPKADAAILAARNRVAHRIQRNLDGIQIALSSRWKYWMQAVAISMTVVIIELALVLTVSSLDLGTMLIGVLFGIVGGYLAPVTRDLVAALQSLRKA